MANIGVTFSQFAPAAPAGRTNVHWLSDGVGNPHISASVANTPDADASTKGLIQLAGDLGGTAAAPLVAKLQGNPVDNTALGAGQDGYVASWVNGTAKITFVSLATIGNANASQLRGINISTTSPVDGQVLRYVSANSDYEPDYLQTNRTVSWNPSIAGSQANTAYGSGFGAGNITIYDVNGTGLNVAPTSSRPRCLNIQTTATASNSAAFVVRSMNGNNNGIGITLGTLRSFKFIIRLAQTTSMRIWVGLSDTAPQSSGGSAPNGSVFRTDTPAANFIGFRYSTAAGDTKWMAVTQTDSSHQTANAETTASHVDTSIHVLELRYDSTTVRFYVDGTLVQSSTTNLPTADTELGFLEIIDNVATSSNQPSFDMFGFRGLLTY